MNQSNYKNQTNSRVGKIRAKVNPISILKEEFLQHTESIYTTPNHIALSE